MILDRWDVPAILRKAAADYRWPPERVWALTPFEALALFGKVEKEAGTTTDKTAILRMHNDLRAKQGKRPAVPPWWGRAKEVPKPRKRKA